MDQDILFQLLKNNIFYNKIIREFPGLYTACLTIKQNISEEAIELAYKKIESFYNENNSFQLFINTFKINDKDLKSQTSNNTNNVAGLIIVLDKKEESYKNLIETSKKENWEYKGISIVDNFDTIRLYFY